MFKIVFGALVAAMVVIASAATVLFCGIPSFAADEPHSDAVFSLIAFVREHSIARASADVVVPGDLASPERVRRAAGNYEAMCAGCHLSPSSGDSEVRKGLYPAPPNLSEQEAAENDRGGRDARRFWIVKHGIKASGMPAWSKSGMNDESIWDLVALLRVLPGMSPSDYHTTVEASGGHSHAGMEHDHDHHGHD